MGLWRARCGANSHAGFGGAGRGNGPSERAAPRPGSTLLLPAGSRRVHLLVRATPATSRTSPAAPRPTSWMRCGWPRWSSGACAGPASCRQPRSARLRDLTRYRRTLIRERTREKQRVEKLLEDAQIKLSSVASDVFGVSGRQLLQAMIGGQRDPKVLAQLARASMRAKLRQLEEALTGHFDDHHAFLCRMMLERIDELTGRIEELTARIDEQVAPFAAQVAQLDAVTGIGPVCAQELIAELGADMAVFPTAGHLVAWAKFAPRSEEHTSELQSRPQLVCRLLLEKKKKKKK